MNALTSMKKKLSPLGLYRLDHSHIEDELYVYALELDRIREESDRLLREMFLSTAMEEGLSMMERMFSRPHTQLSVQTRREMLQKRLCLGLSDFTLEGLRTALDSFHLSHTICEYPSLNKLVVLAQGDYPENEEKWIESEAQKFVPLHLEFQLDFNSLSWEEIDGRDLTYATFDSENRTWKTLDKLRASDI